MCSKDHEQKPVDDYCVDGEMDISKRMVSGGDVLAYIVARIMSTNLYYSNVVVRVHEDSFSNLWMTS